MRVTVRLFAGLREVIGRDALIEEFATPDGEAKRDDENYCFVSAWEFQGVGQAPTLHKEQLAFEAVKLAQRNYK